MRVNLLSLLVLSAIAPSIVAAKEDVVIPNYAQLETKKEDMVFEHDVTKADTKVDEYDDAISKLKDDNTDSRYSETISDLKYAKK